MRTVRCKCGESIAWTTDSFADCQGCTKCNTTYSSHPDYHKELQPHTWKIMYNENTGKPYKTCEKCHEIDEESYKESKIVGLPFDSKGNIIGAKQYNSPAQISDEIVSIPPIIPKDLDEAIKMLTNDENTQFAKDHDEDKFLGSLGMFTGMGIRNSWGLWSGSELRTWFKDRGIHHADDMSGIILISFHRDVNGKDINLDEQIKFYRDYWEKVDPKVNSGQL